MALPEMKQRIYRGWNAAGAGRRAAELAWAVLLVLVSGCIHYDPQPLAPGEKLAEFESRALTDAGLRAFVLTNSSEPRDWPRRSWDLPALALAGIYFHPSLEVARAQAGVAEAEVVTAGGRRNPTISVAPEYALNPPGGVSPWLLGLNFAVPFETAGKRGHRIAQAEQLSKAARIQVAEAAWKVRSGVRAALVEELFAGRIAALLHAECAARSNVVHVMERRFAAGDISRTEVDSAQTDLVRARAALRAAEGRTRETRVALATALGLPAAALEGIVLVWPEFEELPGEESLSQETIQTAGLLNRLDVRRALAEYEATERALQLEVSQQYPDVQWQPGYQFDQGQHQFAFGLGVELPILNQNQGPIAAARARRQEAAARFLGLQAQVVGDLHAAQAQYQSARGEYREIETSQEAQARTERLTERAFELGEVDQLALASMRLQQLLMTRARLDALRRVQMALGALEDAVQRPLPAEGRTSGGPRPA